MNVQPTNERQQFTIPVPLGTIRLSQNKYTPVVTSPSTFNGGLRNATYTLIHPGPGGGVTRLVPSGFPSVRSGSSDLVNVIGQNFRIINPQEMICPGGFQQQKGQYVVRRPGPGAATPARVQVQANRARMVNCSPMQQPLYRQQGQPKNQGINVGGQPTRAIHHPNPPLIGHSPQLQPAEVLNSAGSPIMTNVMQADSYPAMDSVKMASPPTTPQQSLKRKTTKMRLRRKTLPLPLQLIYFANNEVLDKDADVIFLCGDGGRVKGHKLILASMSTFFADAFSDQPLGEISTVSVPDITSDTMKLILLLAYKTRIVVNAEQILKVKEHLNLFGLNFDSLSTEMDIEKGPLDVQSGKVDENIQRVVVGVGCDKDNIGGGSLGLKRKLVPSFTSAQLKNFQLKKQLLQESTKEPVKSLDKPSIDAVPPCRDDNYEASDDETFKIEGYTKESHFERRKAKLTPTIEPEIQDSYETDLINFPDSDENVLKEWMDSVGKNGTDASSDAKRPRLGQKSKLKCEICNATFIKESAWKWHKDRHYNHGIYKCTICDSLQTTARLVWFHEDSFHKVVGLPLEEIEESQNVPAPQPPLRTDQNASPLKPAQLKKIGASKIAGQKKNPTSVKTYRASPKYAIKIGQYSDVVELASKKIKQQHWVYICAKCDNSSDSESKAHLHYEKCYPLANAVFEDTVTKYRRGFYGRSRCPICPRRYVSNGDWTTHVSSQHQSYRKLFSHTENVEDKLQCTSCSKKFSYPEDFDYHLTNGNDGEKECRQEEESMPLLTPEVRNPPIETVTEGPVSGRRKKNSKKKIPQTEAKPTPGKSKPPLVPVAPTHTRLRSARLATKRASTQFKAKVPSDREDSDEKKNPFKRRTSNRTSSATEFPPVDCPICGESDIANISQHLTTEHNEMNFKLKRISVDTLKCRRCRMTFGIDDVFGHPNVCDKNSRTGIDDDNGVSDLSRPAKPRAGKGKVVADQ